MRYSLRALLLTLVFLISHSILVHGQSYSIPEAYINNINIPDDYFICTRDNYDPEMDIIFKESGYSYDKWKNQIMLPDDIFIYAAKENGAVMCVKSEPFTELTFSLYNTEDREEYKEVTILSYDYKLIADSISRDNALKKYRYNVTSTGIEDKEIRRISWIDDATKDCIPYILCLYKDEESYIADFHTVFNGNKISVTVVEPDPISVEELTKLSEVITTMEYTYIPDYTEAKELLKKKNEEDMAEKIEVYATAKLVQYIFGFFIACMILFAIYLDSQKVIIKRNLEFY